MFWSIPDLLYGIRPYIEDNYPEFYDSQANGDPIAWVLGDSNTSHADGVSGLIERPFPYLVDTDHWGDQLNYDTGEPEYEATGGYVWANAIGYATEVSVPPKLGVSTPLDIQNESYCENRANACTTAGTIWAHHSGIVNKLSRGWPTNFKDSHPDFETRWPTLLICHSAGVITTANSFSLVDTSEPGADYADISVLAPHPSGATAQVAALACMLKKMRPEWTGAKIVQCIKDSALFLPYYSFFDGKSKYGVMNFYSATLYAENPDYPDVDPDPIVLVPIIPIHGSPSSYGTPVPEVDENQLNTNDDGGQYTTPVSFLYLGDIASELTQSSGSTAQTGGASATLTAPRATGVTVYVPYPEAVELFTIDTTSTTVDSTAITVDKVAA